MVAGIRKAFAVLEQEQTLAPILLCCKTLSLESSRSKHSVRVDTERLDTSVQKFNAKAKWFILLRPIAARSSSRTIGLRSWNFEPLFYHCVLFASLWHQQDQSPDFVFQTRGHHKHHSWQGVKGEPSECSLVGTQRYFCESSSSPPDSRPSAKSGLMWQRFTAFDSSIVSLYKLLLQRSVFPPTLTQFQYILPSWLGA